MASYDNLPVYKKTYDLLVELFSVCRNMDRDFKFTIGEKLKTEVVELLMNVYRANCRVKRAPLIEAARENTEVVRLMFRLLQDLKQVTLEQFISVNEKIEEISKQLAAWSRYTSNQSQENNKKQNPSGQSSEGQLAFSESTI
jgi:hypothetical protein